MGPKFQPIVAPSLVCSSTHFFRTCDERPLRSLPQRFEYNSNSSEPLGPELHARDVPLLKSVSDTFLIVFPAKISHYHVRISSVPQGDSQTPTRNSLVHSSATHSLVWSVRSVFIKVRVMKEIPTTQVSTANNSETSEEDAQRPD